MSSLNDLNINDKVNPVEKNVQKSCTVSKHFLDNPENNTPSLQTSTIGLKALGQGNRVSWCSVTHFHSNPIPARMPYDLHYSSIAMITFIYIKMNLCNTKTI